MPKTDLPLQIQVDYQMNVMVSTMRSTSENF